MLRTKYDVINGVPAIPDHVFASSVWRNLRQNLDDAQTDEQVIIALSSADFQTDSDMAKAVGRVRSAASGYSCSAGLSEHGLFIRTKVAKVADLPDDIKAPLNEQGVRSTDTIVVCAKTRKSTKLIG